MSLYQLVVASPKRLFLWPLFINSLLTFCFRSVVFIFSIFCFVFRRLLVLWPMFVFIFIYLFIYLYYLPIFIHPFENLVLEWYMFVFIFIYSLYFFIICLFSFILLKIVSVRVDFLYDMKYVCTFTSHVCIYALYPAEVFIFIFPSFFLSSVVSGDLNTAK